MIFPIVTLATTAVLALLFVLLSFRVVGQRTGSKTSLGDGAQMVAMGEEHQASPLFIAVRTHANFAEYVPISLLLLLMLELVGAPRWAVAVLAGLLVLARVAHPLGMLRPTPNALRAGGIVLQWLMLLLGAGYALVLAVALL